jgi:hypothetical protein
MFTLNEAPDTALDAISSHTTKRDCTTLFSVLCCLPTLGVSACGFWCSTAESKCCFPESITLPSKIGLTALKEALNRIKHISFDKDSDDKTRIAWQVKTTIEVLEQVILDDHIQGGYKEVLEEALDNIRIKASLEDAFTHIISSVPVTSITTSLLTPTAPNSESSVCYQSVA